MEQHTRKEQNRNSTDPTTITTERQIQQPQHKPREQPDDRPNPTHHPRNRRFIPKIKYKKEKQKTRKKTDLQDSYKNTIVNLSTLNLTPADYSLLGKGLSFCPTPAVPTHDAIQPDLDAFHRKLRLTHHFSGTETDEEKTINPFRSKSSWNPPRNKCKQLETYIDTTNSIIQSSFPLKQHHNNLTTEEQQALMSLKKNRNIIIKPADKGGALVIQNTIDYKNEALRQLTNRTHYHRMTYDPTKKFALEINKYISTLTIHMDKKTISYLQNNDPRTPQFYMLPKIHKVDNPGRPIISANDSPTEHISGYVDHHLRPLVYLYPSHLKDTTDFLLNIEQFHSIIRPGVYLVTADVSALYTSIPHQDGIMACNAALNRRHAPTIPTSTIIRFIKFILSKNNFSFNNDHYIQIQGTAMGTKMAPSYANIFMGELEGRFLHTCTRLPLLYKRYIDDIFILWTYSEPELLTFLNNFNNFHKTIKFTWEYSQSEIHFLDTTVYILINKLLTKVYHKPTDTHPYLLNTSCHPTHCKAAIPFSQALRFRRICTLDTDFLNSTALLKKFLVCRGYKPTTVNEAILKAFSIARNKLLHPDTNALPTRNIIPLIITFHPSLPQLSKALHTPWSHLKDIEDGEVYKDTKPMVAFRRAKNLRAAHARNPVSPANLSRQPKLSSTSTRNLHTQ
jgi:hypothetical protein